MKSHLDEPWEYPEYPWRAVHDDGDLVYAKEKMTPGDDGGFNVQGEPDFQHSTYLPFDGSDWQNSLQSKEDYEKRQHPVDKVFREIFKDDLNQEPLQGIYEAKGVKFPAWVEVYEDKLCRWLKAECMAVDINGSAVVWGDPMLFVHCYRSWRPIQPVDIDDLKRRAYL